MCSSIWQRFALFSNNNLYLMRKLKLISGKFEWDRCEVFSSAETERQFSVLGDIDFPTNRRPSLLLCIT